MRNWLFGISSLATGVLIIAFLIFFRNLPPEIPWFYSLPWGEEILVNKFIFGGGLVVLLLVIGVNFFIARRYEKSDKVVAKVIEWATFLLTMMYLAGFVRVLSIIL